MWPKYSTRDYNNFKTKTFFKERNDTLVLISNRIKDFFLKHNPKENIDSISITKYAQHCMKHNQVFIKYL